MTADIDIQYDDADVFSLGNVSVQHGQAFFDDGVRKAVLVVLDGAFASVPDEPDEDVQVRRIVVALPPKTAADVGKALLKFVRSMP